MSLHKICWQLSESLMVPLFPLAKFNALLISFLNSISAHESIHTHNICKNSYGIGFYSKSETKVTNIERISVTQEKL